MNTRLISVSSSTSGPVDFGDLPVNTQTDILKQCDSDACKAATNAIQPARNTIFQTCALIAVKQKERNTAALAAVGLWMAAMAAVGAALAAFGIFIIGPFIAIGLLIAAGVIVISAIGASIVAAVKEQQLAGLRRQLADLQSKWSDLVDAVMQSCPEYCRPDLELPRC